MIFDKIIKIKGGGNYRIKGFNRNILEVSTIGGAAIMFPLLVSVFSCLFYPISIVSWEALGLGIGTIFIITFGFGYQIKVTPTTFYFYTICFFVPFLRIKENLKNVILKETGFWEKVGSERKIVIYKGDNPSAEMEFSDCVSIKRGNKEFYVETNGNYKELLATIKNAIDLMKKNSSETL